MKRTAISKYNYTGLNQNEIKIVKEKIMSAIAMKTANLMNDFADYEQNLILGIVKMMHDNLRKAQNVEYLNMVQEAIERVAEGGGTVREIIEVSDYD
ncbi:MAG: hypothetical protein FWE90_06285 [Defluviitaleaceae bacterium]|nr:hypothetical protein [Defluviitaleaceae bacterium]